MVRILQRNRQGAILGKTARLARQDYRQKGVEGVKIAYVAGAYRSKFGKLGVIVNILKARKVAKQLWKMGYATVCPHSNSGLMDGTVTDETFLRGDLDILAKCDLLVLVNGWEKSHGTHGEIRFAKDLGIKIWEFETLKSYIEGGLTNG